MSRTVLRVEGLGSCRIPISWGAVVDLNLAYTIYMSRARHIASN